MAYRTILAAYDGSEQSIRALKAAIEMAKDWKAALHVVHAYQIPVAVMGEVMVPPAVDTSVAISEEAENMAEEVRSILASTPGLDADATVVHGEPGRSILETAGRLGADLIVIGSRGNNGLKEFLLGSISHYVAQHATIPVHIVK